MLNRLNAIKQYLNKIINIRRPKFKYYDNPIHLYAYLLCLFAAISIRWIIYFIGGNFCSSICREI
jgi:hypothetical protein